MPTSYRVGAELFLGTSGFTGPARQAVGMLENIARQSGLTGGQLRGLAGDFTAAGASIAGGIKLLREWNEGVALARDLAQDRVLLEIEVARVGMNPEDFGREMDAYRARAFEVQSKLSGDMGDMLRMYAVGLKSGVPGATMTGGLDLAAGYLADVEGMDKGLMVGQLNKASAPFNIAPENLTSQVADPLFRYAHSGLMDVPQALHELERAAPAMASMGSNFEDTMIALEAIAMVRPEGAGRALMAFRRDVTQADMVEQQRRYGFDPFDDKGNILPPEQLEVQAERIFGEMTPEKRATALNTMFSDIGSLYIEALSREGKQASGLRSIGVSHIGLIKAFEDYISQTYGYQKESLEGTMSSAKAVAFGPAEQMMKEIAQGFNERVITPIGERIVKDEQLQKNISFGGLAAGIGLLGAGGWFGLRGLKNAWGLAGGVARGEALQTVFPDIQKVYVVNATEIGTASGTAGVLGNALGGIGRGSAGGAVSTTAGRVLTNRLGLGGGLRTAMRISPYALATYLALYNPDDALAGAGESTYDVPGSPGKKLGVRIAQGAKGVVSENDLKYGRHHARWWEGWGKYFLQEGLFNENIGNELADQSKLEVGWPNTSEGPTKSWLLGASLRSPSGTLNELKEDRGIKRTERAEPVANTDYGPLVALLRASTTPDDSFNQKLGLSADAINRAAQALEQAAVNLKTQSGTRTPAAMNGRGV